MADSGVQGRIEAILARTVKQDDVRPSLGERQERIIDKARHTKGDPPTISAEEALNEIRRVLLDVGNPETEIVWTDDVGHDEQFEYQQIKDCDSMSVYRRRPAMKVTYPAGPWQPFLYEKVDA